MPDIPEIEPQSFIAGDTVKWTKSLSDYPADESWVLAYEFRSVRDNTAKTVTCEADGSDHLATITAANSAAYFPGEYQVTGRASKAGEVYTVFRGRVTVEQNPSVGTSGVEHRSTARRLLAAVESALQGVATREEKSYEITPSGGTSRRIEFCSLADLLSARDKLKAEVRREEQAERISQGRKSGNTVRFRFT